MQKYSSNNRCSAFCCTFKLDSWTASKYGNLNGKKYHWWDCWESISCFDGESTRKETRQSAGWRREEIEFENLPLSSPNKYLWNQMFDLVTWMTFNGRFVWCCTRYERSCWSMFHFMVKYLRFWCQSGPRPIQIKSLEKGIHLQRNRLFEHLNVLQRPFSDWTLENYAWVDFTAQVQTPSNSKERND